MIPSDQNVADIQRISRLEAELATLRERGALAQAMGERDRYKADLALLKEQLKASQQATEKLQNLLTAQDKALDQILRLCKPLVSL
jgi:DNA repair exonuclease SbcCD ATPase subunit